VQSDTVVFDPQNEPLALALGADFDGAGTPGG
jgi:hypothetical protein